jgi:aminopeptidase N
MKLHRFWCYILVYACLIAGFYQLDAVFNPLLGKEDLRGTHLHIKRHEIWNTDKLATTSFDEMVDTLSRQSIVYIGEKHDNAAHHQLQLNIIKALYEKNPQIVIGMEMFQKPYQKVLDLWINNEINEGMLLDEVEWYYYWDVPYEYYKGIMDFAREKDLPLIAINLSRDLIAKVMSKGIDLLTEDERKLLPHLTPITKKYEDFMKENYTQHPDAFTPSLENFILTQRLWDDTMAETISALMERNAAKNAQMVVITGGGHIMHDLGIPDRIFAHNQLSYATVLPIEIYHAGGKEVDRDIGDFVIGTEPPTVPPKVPFLGVASPGGKREGGGIEIRSVMKDSIAKKSGIMAGDIMIRFDNNELSNFHSLTRLIRDGGWDRRVEIVLLRNGEKVVVEAIFPPEPSNEDG